MDYNLGLSLACLESKVPPLGCWASVQRTSWRNDDTVEQRRSERGGSGKASQCKNTSLFLSPTRKRRRPFCRFLRRDVDKSVVNVLDWLQTCRWCLPSCQRRNKQTTQLISVSIAAPPGVSMELKPRFRENTHFNKRHFNNITVINVAWTLCEQQGFFCLSRAFVLK